MRVIFDGEQTDYGPVIGYAVHLDSVCWALTADFLVVGNNGRMVSGRRVFDVLEVRQTPPEVESKKTRKRR